VRLRRARLVLGLSLTLLVAMFCGSASAVYWNVYQGYMPGPNNTPTAFYGSLSATTWYDRMSVDDWQNSNIVLVLPSGSWTHIYLSGYAPSKDVEISFSGSSYNNAGCQQNFSTWVYANCHVGTGA
jgi:hypothetical protein